MYKLKKVILITKPGFVVEKKLL